MSLGVIARFSTIGEAGSARSALEAAGIDSVLADDEIVAIDWLYSNAVGGVKLVVRDEEREQARNILETPPAEPDAIDSNAPDVASMDAEATELPQEQQDGMHCPACGSSEATRTPRLMLFLFLAVVLCGVGLAVGQVQLGVTAAMTAALILAMVPTHHCTACGKRWSATGQSAEVPSPAFSDTVEERCPRCGSTEFHHIDYRRLKAITLLIAATLLVLLPVWMFLPKKHCDQCGMSA
jgi:Zn finger protein HypA/HybF involved in hydrogenase expression